MRIQEKPEAAACRNRDTAAGKETGMKDYGIIALRVRYACPASVHEGQESSSRIPAPVSMSRKPAGGQAVRKCNDPGAEYLEVLYGIKGQPDTGPADASCGEDNPGPVLWMAE